MPELTILEPMSIGDVIDRSVRLYRKNFAALISIVALPCLVGYVATLTFLYGYSRLLVGIAEGPSPLALLSLLFGGLLYPIYSFLLLAVIAGLARSVGDNLMLGEKISFRHWFTAARKRLGSIALMWILMLGLGVMLYILVAVFAFVLVILVALFAGISAAASLPPWLIATLGAIGVIALIGAIIFVALFVLSRVVFVPQIVMIEGETAGAAIGRAIRLGGGGNWHKLGAIVLFTYFVTFSIQLAMVVPFGTLLYISGFLTQEFFLSPMWNAIYGAFGQVSNLLVLPIWIVSLTLLYFDSRVRKEAYDVELLVRQMNPEEASAVAAYPTPSTAVAQPAVASIGRGWPLSVVPPPEPFHGAYTQPIPDAVSPEPSLEPEYSTAVESPSEPVNPEPPVEICSTCDAVLEPQARFCHICGASAPTDSSIRSRTQDNLAEP